MSVHVMIFLPPAELSRAARIAHERHAPKRAKGVRNDNHWQTDRSQQSIDVLGVEGEMAAAQLLGSDIDAMSRLSGDGGVYDLAWHDKLIQVKTGQKRGYGFAMNTTSLDEFKADYGMLVWKISKTPGAYEIVGVISREDFPSHSTIRDYGYGERRIVECDRMIRVAQFLSRDY